MKLSNLNVWYGWSIVNKIRKKPSLSVIFDNGGGNSERGLKSLSRFQKTFYTRKQTIEEAEDAKYQNKIFTEYNTFIFEKPFNGDIDKILDNNYKADVNNVSHEVLLEIQLALKEGYKNFYQALINKNKTINTRKK
jgi:hypothetical protein